MPGIGDHLRELAASTIGRPGADPTYADGDDATWMEVDWPSLTRSLVVMGRRMSVVDTGGDEPPLLFLHGLGGLWQNWLLNIPAFMDSHRVVAPDLPGFGRSEAPAGKVSIHGYGRIVDALCKELGLREVAVVGNSMGGFIGAELAHAFSTRVRRLVLVSAAGLSVEHLWREPLLVGARAFGVLTTRAGLRSEPIVRRARLRRLFLQPIVRYPEKLSGPLAMELVAGSGSTGFMPAFEAVLNHSFRDHLGDIEVPVLIVWGRNDVLVPVADAFEFERLIGDNARAVIFEDTGHLSMLERPSRFNALLRDFLAGERAPEAGVEGVSR